VPLEGAAVSVALQVDQVLHPHLEESGPNGPCMGAAWNQAGARLLQEGDIIISDLLPFSVDDVVDAHARLSEGFNMDNLKPFLSQDLGHEEAIGVYFEVYSQSDPGDNYMIEYAVRKRTRGRLLQRGQTRTTLYHARRASVEGRLQAAFLIDRAEWEGAEEMEVVATVTNLVTDRSVEQSEVFRVSR
jgi:hypothetical protein